MKKKNQTHLGFLDIEEASDASSMLESVRNSPKHVVEPVVNQIKNEPVELQVMLPVETEKHRRNQPIKYDDLQFSELEQNDDGNISIDSIEAIQIVEEQPVINQPEPIQEEQPYLDQQLEDIHYEEEQEPEKDSTTKPQSATKGRLLNKKPIKERPKLNDPDSKRVQIYDPKSSLIYLRLMGTPELYKIQPRNIVEEAQEQRKDRDEFVDDLVVMQNIMIGLSIGKSQQQPHTKYKIEGQDKQDKQRVKSRPQVEVQKAQPTRQLNQSQLRQERLERQMQAREQQKILEQKQVLLISAKKVITNGLILYRSNIRERQREHRKWLRYSELAQIYKGSEEIFTFERRLSEQLYNEKLLTKPSYTQHRIAKGVIVESIKIYLQQKPKESKIPEKHQRKQITQPQGEENKTNDTPVKKQQSKVADNESTKANIKQDKSNRTKKPKQNDEEIDILDADTIVIYKGRKNTDRLNRLERRKQAELHADNVMSKQNKRSKLLQNQNNPKFLSRLETNKAQQLANLRKKGKKVDPKDALIPTQRIYDQPPETGNRRRLKVIEDDEDYVKKVKRVKQQP